MTRYEADFFEWTQETAQAIAQGRWDEIDRAALADEVESLGKRDRKEVRSRLTVLLQHMLKAKYQAERASRSWDATIRDQRWEIGQSLKDSPSLRARIDELIAEAYPQAVFKASDETGIAESLFPATCEWSAIQVLG